MADAIQIQLTGLEPLVKKLIELGKLESVKAGLKAGALHIKSIVAKYPPSTEANRPGRTRTVMLGDRLASFRVGYYERGKGWWQPIRGLLYVNKRGSETLGRKWTVKYQDNDMTAVLGNNASYAKWVHGEEQASFHQARGWKTAQQVADDETAKVQKFIEDYLRAEVAKI